MIYIAYIIMFILYVFVVDLPDSAKVKSIELMWDGLKICILVVPIWYGIRECTWELKKIRKLMEGKSNDYNL